MGLKMIFCKGYWGLRNKIIGKEFLNSQNIFYFFLKSFFIIGVLAVLNKFFFRPAPHLSHEISIRTIFYSFLYVIIAYWFVTAFEWVLNKFWRDKESNSCKTTKKDRKYMTSAIVRDINNGILDIGTSTNTEERIRRVFLCLERTLEAIVSCIRQSVEDINREFIFGSLVVPFKEQLLVIMRDNRSKHRGVPKLYSYDDLLVGEVFARKIIDEPLVIGDVKKQPSKYRHILPKDYRSVFAVGVFNAAGNPLIGVSLDSPRPYHFLPMSDADEMHTYLLPYIDLLATSIIILEQCGSLEDVYANFMGGDTFVH